jgi:hypothetical protein
MASLGKACGCVSQEEIEIGWLAIMGGILDPSETNNLASKHPDVVRRLAKAVVGWHKAMPQDKGATFKLKKRK